ncbi:MAG: nuclear transport factor 2 family protein [Candidatus Hodarchaeota archaeon]
MKESEVMSIQQSLDIFVEGLRKLDYNLISKIFFKDGLSCCSRNSKISYVVRDHWREMAEQRIANGKNPESSTASYSIRSLNIIGNAASVIIDLSFGSKTEITERYIDFYHMVKVTDKWVIVNKIFPSNITKVEIPQR